MANSGHIKWLLEGVESWNARRGQEDFVPDFAGANIYEEFRKAGKLNHDGKIPLSRINLRKVNFHKSCLYDPSSINGADLSHANLWWANLKHAQLANSKLDDAVLNGANFERANLTGASLRGAKMASTTFSGANLFQANLKDTDVANAFFRDANLCHATLEGTDLANATLTGVDLAYSQPWRAKLFTDINSMSSVSHDKCVRCVADLIKACRNFGGHGGHTLYFRGERTTTWELRPSVMRRCSRGDKLFTFRDKEGEMLVDLMSRRPEDFANTTSALGQWVLAQHHGLKTRLLDVTRNPLAALYWACTSDGNDGPGRLHIFSVPRTLIKPFNSDAISILANFAKLSLGGQNALLGIKCPEQETTQKEGEGRSDEPIKQGVTRTVMGGLYHMIKEEKPHFKEEIDPRDYFRVFVVEPQQSFERIRAQSGAFLISAFHERFECSEVLNWNPGIPIYGHSMLEVPEGNKQHILDELRLLNITRETLFPGLDEAATAITKIHSK